MIDIQNEHDTREIPLQKVGVKNVLYPVSVLDKANKTQQTHATVDLFVNLPHHYKGTHMSRFIETFHKHSNDISMKNFHVMLEELRQKLDAERAYGLVKFPFFMEKEAPVSKLKGMLCYTCSYEGAVELVENQLQKDFFVTIEVPITSLCPCSKAISNYGAHNQRGLVTVKVRNTHFFWIEDIIMLVEKCASSELYSMLKRQDEKFVTERAYDNPRFVEDIVREVYTALQQFDDKNPFDYFSVEAENYESIHTHNAYAFTEFYRN